MRPAQVLVLFTQISYPVRPDFFSLYYCPLPLFIQTRIDSYLKIQDKVAGILGKQLLIYSLKKLGLKWEYIETLKYKKNNRPYLSLLPHLDFNISHSEAYVVCAVSADVRIGIDIEKQKAINITNLKDQFSPDQWQQIEHSPDPQSLFYQYWVQKESIVKADDSAIPIPFSAIKIKHNKAAINENDWYLTRLNIDASYCSWLAANNMIEIILEQVHF